MSYAFIEATHHEIWRGRGYETYQWVGPRNAPVVVSYDIDTRHLPWPLRKIDECLEWNGDYYVRTDVAFWWVTAALARMKRPLQWVYVRLIITAEIWGVGRTAPGEFISWRNLLRKRR